MKFDLRAINTDSIKKGLNYIKFNGIEGVVSKVKYKMSGPGLSYNGWYKEVHEADEEVLISQRETEFAYAPKISILVSVYMTPEFFLRAMIESVQKQTYANWELCIVDGSQAVDTRTDIPGEQSVYEQVYSRETEKTIHQYADNDERIRYILLDENRGICDNTNQALEMATGDYIALLDHDDVLTEDALYQIVAALNTYPAEILYSDEDKMSEDGTKYSDPAFKTRFNMDLLRCYHYMGNFLVVKSDLARRVGGFRKEYDAVRDYDFVLRCCEMLFREQWDMIYNKIVHIPRVLYHTRLHARTTDTYLRKKEQSDAAGKKALTEHLQRLGYFATVSLTDRKGIYHVIYDTPGNPLLSIVVTSGGNPEILEKCLMPLFERTRYSNFEIMIVDGEVDNEMLTYYRKLEMMHKNMRVVICRDKKGLAAKRNYGASFAKGDYILFLDGNVEIMESTAISEMIGCCMRDEIGAAGGMLYAENGATVSSGIVIRGDGMFMDVYRGVRKGVYGYLMHNRMNCDYSAVSAACLMVKKKLFDALGGFQTDLSEGLSEVDFCLKIWEQQKIVVSVAGAGWCRHIHGAPGKQTEPQSEEWTARMLEAHANYLEKGDPYYNQNFATKGEPFAL